METNSTLAVNSPAVKEVPLLSDFDMKEHRRQMREEQKRNKTIAKRNEYGISDPTPYNAINRIVKNNWSIQYK